MDPVDELLTTYDDQGYVILRDVLDAKQVEATRTALAPYLELELSGRNTGVRYQMSPLGFQAIDRLNGKPADDSDPFDLAQSA